jgi:tetratricopeptide (TPR) repeat protein
MLSHTTLALLCACTVMECAHGDDGSTAVTLRTTPAITEDSIRTTDPGIALGNLNAQIAGMEARAATRSLGAAQQADLASLLFSRAQYTGRISDRERALRIAETLVREHPDDPVALLTAARGRAAVHRFTDALADLDRAQAAGASRASTDGARAGILQALGRYDDALAIRARAAQARPDSDSLGALASLRAERGEVDEAARAYADALQSFRDVSPFPLAWLRFDEGLMWMRQGNHEQARALFAAAHRRLPSFAAAQCHLAEMEAAIGNTDRAVELLRPLAERADDPDAAGQLARILAEGGRADEARKWRDAAAARYDVLLARHPEAYADHGAEFWLSAGGDPRRALALAQRNLALRQTPRAYELVLAAALASGDDDVTCVTRRQAARMKGRSPALAALVARAATGCARRGGS